MELTPAEIVRKAYGAWNHQDLDALGAVFHPDVVYDFSERVFNPDVYRGHDGLRRLGDEIRQAWKSFEVEVQDLIEVDDERVIALQHSTGVAHASGVEVDESQSATLWTVREGQVVHAKLYVHRRDAFAEAGIPYPGTE